PALRPWRLRRDRPAYRRPDRAGGGGGQRGDLPDDRQPAPPGPAARVPLLPGDPDLPRARPPGRHPPAIGMADRVLPAHRDRPSRAGGAAGPDGAVRPDRPGPRHHPADRAQEPARPRERPLLIAAVFPSRKYQGITVKRPAADAPGRTAHAPDLETPHGTAAGRRPARPRLEPGGRGVGRVGAGLHGWGGA